MDLLYRLEKDSAILITDMSLNAFVCIDNKQNAFTMLSSGYIRSLYNDFVLLESSFLAGY
jgi:hypothetical protein